SPSRRRRGGTSDRLRECGEFIARSSKCADARDGDSPCARRRSKPADPTIAYRKLASLAPWRDRRYWNSFPRPRITFATRARNVAAPQPNIYQLECLNICATDVDVVRHNFRTRAGFAASRLDLIHVLNQEGRASTGSGERVQTRRVLVVTELALSLVLMI